MNIWLYCQVGEEDLLMPYFLRWYAPEVDRLIMLDGGMSDKTREIVQGCANAEIRDCPYKPDNFDDQLYIDYIAMLYYEARGQADWVIFVDVDEFLYQHNKSLRHALNDAKYIDGIRAIQATGYQMAADEFPTEDAQLPDLVHIGVYDKVYDKVCCFDPDLWLYYSVGRHSASIRDYRPIKTGMKLLHYRYFGEEYTRQRNARNYARRSEADKSKNYGYQAAPDYETGRYSIAWYKDILRGGQDVVTDGELWPMQQPQS